MMDDETGGRYRPEHTNFERIPAPMGRENYELALSAS